MPRKVLAVTAWLGVSVACRDAPSALAGPADTGPMHQPVVAMAAPPPPPPVRTAVDLLNDPFVREMMRATRGSFAALESAVLDATHYGGQEQTRALARIIAETRSGLVGAREEADGGADEAILRSALVMVLEDAARWLVRDVPVATDEDAARIREPGQHDGGSQDDQDR